MIMMMMMNVVMKTCEGLGDHRRRHVMGREGHLADPHHQHHHSCTVVNLCICTTTLCTFLHFSTFVPPLLYFCTTTPCTFVHFSTFEPPLLYFCATTTCTFVHLCTFASAGGRCADISKLLPIIFMHFSSLYTFCTLCHSKDLRDAKVQMLHFERVSEKFLLTSKCWHFCILACIDRVVSGQIALCFGTEGNFVRI